MAEETPRVQPGTSSSRRTTTQRWTVPIPEALPGGTRSSGRLGFFLAWAVVFADIGTSITASGFVDFARTEFAVNNPTSLAWGPDNRLYVGGVQGTVTAFTLDADNQVLAEETE